MQPEFPQVNSEKVILHKFYLKSCLVVWIFLHFPKSRIPTSYMLTFSIKPFSVFLLSCNSRDLSSPSLRMPLEWHLLYKRMWDRWRHRGRGYMWLSNLFLSAPPLKEVEFVPLSSPHSQLKAALSFPCPIETSIVCSPQEGRKIGKAAC